MLQRCRASAAGGLARSISKDGERSSTCAPGTARTSNGLLATVKVPMLVMSSSIGGLTALNTSRAPTAIRLRTSPSSGALWVL